MKIFPDSHIIITLEVYNNSHIIFSGGFQMKYKGEKCFLCSNDFNDDDDVVVCPECGTPYHRECYRQAGSCINHQLHESGESWHENHVKADEPENINNDTAEIVINSNSGNSDTWDNSEQAFENTENDFLKFDMNKPFFGLDPNEDFEGACMSEIFAFVKTNTIYYIPIFKKMKSMGSKISFNLTSFFFPYFYFANRKMWLMTIISVCIMLLLQIPSALISLSDNIAYGIFDETMIQYAQSVLKNLLTFINDNYNTIETFAWICNIGIYIFRFAMCLLGNWLYYRFTIKSVNKIKLRCSDPVRRMSIISSSGGTNMMNIFLTVLIIFAGYIFLSFFIDIISVLI